jgi:hypothetical protein
MIARWEEATGEVVQIDGHGIAPDEQEAEAAEDDEGEMSE